ncbi:MAG TPA: molybdate ABC transporter permease subunit [Cytophagaceae bacterium]|jgi:molybdate transport system permease protein|nr:molybdate ABC transporter permease subunit [Cytophagaceae bacterium]
MNNWEPLFLSFKLSLITTFILVLIGVPFAYWLAYTKVRLKPVLESILSLPLVLPPSVLGFYLLLAFSPNNFLGKFLDTYLNIRLVFSFEGLLVASVLYSFPFMIYPIQAGFQSLPLSLKEASYTLGISPFKTFLNVMIPNIKPALLSGIVLTFAHTVGEFGVVLMIGGNIPGVSKVASIAIYDEVESMNYDAANFYAEILVLISFIILLLLFWFNKKLTKSSEICSP